MTTIGVHRGRLPSRLRDAAGAVLADAFVDDPWPGHEAGPRDPAAVALLMTVALVTAARRGGSLVARDEDDRPVGAAAWVPADRRSAGALDAVRAGAASRLALVLRARGLRRVLGDEADTARYVDGLVRDGDAYLWVLGVARDRHGRGVGRALVEAVLADAAAAGHRRLVLVTHDPSNVARYEAMGFTPLGRSARASGLVLHGLARPTA